MATVYYLEQFEGHSLATTTLIEKNGQLLVRKEAAGTQALAIPKLQEQCEWMQNLPSQFRRFFPKIIAAHTGHEYFSYDMRYHPLPSLADLFHSGLFDKTDLLQLLEKIIAFTAHNFFPHQTQSVPKDFFLTEGVQKLLKRIAEAEKMSPEFAKFNKHAFFTFNEKKVRSGSALLRFFSEKTWQHRLTPEILGFTHGDLTFGNILTNGKTFVLIDPRGDQYNTLFYDLAKLYQSMVCSLEPVMNGAFRVTIKGNQVNTAFKKNHPGQNLSSEVFFDFLSAYPVITKEPHWKEKILFFAAAHFIGAVPFRLNDGGFPVATHAYLCGLEILESLLEKHA
jgi:hypothetical protein